MRPTLKSKKPRNSSELVRRPDISSPVGRVAVEESEKSTQNRRLLQNLGFHDVWTAAHRLNFAGAGRGARGRGDEGADRARYHGTSKGDFPRLLPCEHDPFALTFAPGVARDVRDAVPLA